MLTRILVLSACALILSGCGLAERRRQALHRADYEVCASYGFVPQTAAFATCMMRRAEQREHAAESRRLIRCQQAMSDPGPSAGGFAAGFASGMRRNMACR